MRLDLVVNPFDADVAAMATLAADAEDAGVSGVWVPDHFSGAVVGAQWSRDPFVCLGAIAMATSRVRLGPLVANVRNRHPAQLASAVNSLASLAPDRIVLGVGSGAAPGSRFAVEHEAIGTELGDASARRARLVEHIGLVRALYRGREGTDPRLAVTDGAPCPPIVVGASALATVEVALEHADGVNLRAGPQVSALVERCRRSRRGGFEISVLVGADISGDAVDGYRRLGIDRLVVGVDLADGGAEATAVLERVRATWST